MQVSRSVEKIKVGYYQQVTFQGHSKSFIWFSFWLDYRTTGRIQKLVWLKEGLQILHNPDYKTDFLDGSTARLTIDEALPEDSSIFTCRAYGEEETVMVETSGRLTIRGNHSI